MEMKIKRLVEAHNEVIAEMAKVCPAWQPKKLRALQVAAGLLAAEIGKVKGAANMYVDCSGRLVERPQPNGEKDNAID